MTCCIRSRNDKKVKMIVIDFTPITHVAPVLQRPNILYINFPFDVSTSHMNEEYLSRLENIAILYMKKHPAVPVFFIGNNVKDWHFGALVVLKLISEENRTQENEIRSATLVVVCDIGSNISDSEAWAKRVEVPVIRGTPNEIVGALCKIANNK